MDKSKFAIYNPHNRPVEELPTIFGFNNGGSEGFMSGALIAEDGTVLGGHLCSSEGFMYGDLGIIEGRRLDRHEGFKKHYPDGYKMDFVTYNEVSTHEALNKAFELNDKQQEKQEEL